MKSLDTGKDKIDQIATLLRKQTLEPAEAEANRLLEAARIEAEEILKTAKAEAEELHQVAREAVEKERQVFHSSLGQATKQSLAELRQQIEQQLFNNELDLAITSASADPKLVERLLTALVEAIEREGVSTNFSAVIAKTASKEEVMALLANRIVQKLREKEVVLGEIGGGVRLKLHDQNITLDASDEALRELLKRYVRKEFWEHLFGSA